MNRKPSLQPVEGEKRWSTGAGDIQKYAAAFLILALLATIFVMYRTIAQKNQAIGSLQQENALSEEEQARLNAYIGEVTETINSVETKLQDVRSKQVSITGMIKQGEQGETKKDQILQNIAVVEEQLKKDKKDISDLQDKMRKSNVRIKFLDEMVANLNQEIENNQKNMADLRVAIEEKDRVIVEKDAVIKSKDDSLNYANANYRMATGELEQTHQLLDETRNTAYYVIGNKKDLLANNVLEETGGFLRKKLTFSPNFDNTSFTKIHIARESEFFLNCRKNNVQLMPARSADTFILEPTGDDTCLLKVTNPEQFWKMPYLVIITKENSGKNAAVPSGLRI